jgi:hypothetical protein
MNSNEYFYPNPHGPAYSVRLLLFDFAATLIIFG